MISASQVLYRGKPRHDRSPCCMAVSVQQPPQLHPVPGKQVYTHYQIQQPMQCRRGHRCMENTLLSLCNCLNYRNVQVVSAEHSGSSMQIYEMQTVNACRMQNYTYLLHMWHSLPVYVCVCALCVHLSQSFSR